MISEQATLIIFLLMGAIVSADTEAAWQSMVSQPLVACTGAGLLFGNVMLGSSIGLLLQLPYLAETPMGGSRISHASLGAFVAAGVGLRTSPALPELPNLVLVASLVYGIILSWLAPTFVVWLRRANYRLVVLADQAALKGAIAQISRLNYVGVVFASLFGVLFCAFFLLIGEMFLLSFVARLPVGLDQKLMLVRPALLGAGIGVAGRLFLQKKTVKSLLVGVAIALILVMTIKS